MKKLISTLRALYPLSDACIERIVSMVSVRRLARGEFLLSGEVGRDCLYFIESGSVACFARYGNGESNVKWQMRKPRFISTLLPPADGAEIICCVSECEVVVITASQVEELEAEFPELLQVYGMMIARMQRLENSKQSRFLNSVVERGDVELVGVNVGAVLSLPGSSAKPDSLDETIATGMAGRNTEGGEVE